MDQTALALLEATGRNQLIQAVWWYERAVDLEGLERFVDTFASGWGNRVVERASLPGARARWVRPQAEPTMRVAAGVRPRADLVAWADGCAAGSLDPVRGPSWCLDVQRFDDGSVAVCFTASHVIGDAFGAFLALSEAIAGEAVDPGYERAGTRSRVAAVASDSAQVVRDLPATVRALRVAGRLWWQRTRSRAPRPDPHGAAPRAPDAEHDDEVEVHIPSVVVRVDIDRWSGRAHDHGGNAATLLMAFAARLAERVGHTGADGQVTLVMPVNVREGPADHRALAFRLGRATIAPASTAGDHGPLRQALQGVRAAATADDGPVLMLLPLVPWLPRRAIAWLADVMFAYSDDAPVSLSNVGVLPAALGCIDGTETDWFVARAVDTKVRLGDLRRTNGHLVIVASALRSTVRARRAWTISVGGYEVGADNSAAHLSRMVSETLAELGVPGRIETGDDAPAS